MLPVIPPRAMRLTHPAMTPSAPDDHVGREPSAYRPPAPEASAAPRDAPTGTSAAPPAAPSAPAPVPAMSGTAPAGHAASPAAALPSFHHGRVKPQTEQRC